ncbi:MAG: penicillin-binding protein [Hyphomicrobiales bacterium]|nr:penicillin-binding protein [Hyphomicrobiales bacterium]
MARRKPPADLRLSEEDRIAGGRAKPGPARRKRGLLARLFLGKGRKASGGKGEKGASGRRKARRTFAGFLVYWSSVAAVWGVIGVGGVIAWHAAHLPPIDQLAVPKRPPNIAILGEDGALLANRGDTGGPAIHIQDLPPYLPKAFIAIEDRRFYAHWGVDVLGVGRALWRNAAGGGGMQGGSTLTQQLAKNLFLTQERTMSRKVQEAILAIWLERSYSKDQILELYLNRVYFGSGAYGVEAAAQKYFGRSARQVTLSEAAILAGLMVAPSRLAPNRNPRGASDRAALVLLAMARDGAITENMAKLALGRPAEAVRDPGAGSVNYAADYVMDVLDETIGAIDEDIVVSTTLSGPLQVAAEKALAEELNRNGARYGVTQGAFVGMDPAGQIRALVGGRNYADSQFNRAVAARRQPGSAFKPFVYLTAIERGLTPDSVRDDAPLNVRGWKPENSTREYQGPVTLTRALAQSLNTVAVRLAVETGPKAVAATARKLGVQSEMNVNASLALGTSEVTPLELVAAYAPFANGGIRIQPHVITQVKTASGKMLYRRKGSSFGRAVELRHIGMMNTMMQETLLTGTARKAELRGWQAAGKTGTSQDYRDGWFVGYTSRMVAGVWLGNDDSSPTKRVSGGNLPAEIWKTFMQEAHRNAQPQPLPGVGWRDQPLGPPPETEAAIASATPPLRPAAASAITGYLTAAPPQAPPRPPARRAPAGDALIPPADVGVATGRAAGEKGFLDKLFGG